MDDVTDVAAKFAQALRADKVRLYRKNAKADIRPAITGESIATVIDGEQETVNTAHTGDFVVRGAKGERYIIKPKALAERYGPPLTGPNDEGYRVYSAKGKLYAFRYEGEPFKFIAPWGEQMIANPGDYIGTNALGSGGYYRVEKNAFAATYVAATDDKPDA
jgi:hypothetical protein